MSCTSIEMSRRAMLARSAGAVLAASACGAGAETVRVPVRPITQGPKHHWFGYYDKLQIDPSERYVLGMEVDFEGRSPRAGDGIRIGMVDLEDKDWWVDLGPSTAWSWQQGCMLQWIPGTASELVWNDREDGAFVARVLDVKSGARRTLPQPIYALSPDGKTAITTDFRRLNDTRPGYGYAGIPDPNKGVLAPEDVGIFRMDMASGDSELILSVAEAAAVAGIGEDSVTAKHYFNHLLVSPGGTRFIFLHRWKRPGENAFQTRMFTAKMDGSDLRVIDPYGKTSHFIWRDPEHILAWAYHPSHGNAFYLYEDKVDGAVTVVGEGVMTQNGHCTYLPGGRFIVNDTYPGKDRLQTVYLYEIATGKVLELGRFESPPEYTGEWRVDTHPRYSPKGDFLVIDSPHTGEGRQMHLIDLKSIVG